MNSSGLELDILKGQTFWYIPFMRTPRKLVRSNWICRENALTRFKWIVLRCVEHLLFFNSSADVTQCKYFDQVLKHFLLTPFTLHPSPTHTQTHTHCHIIYATNYNIRFKYVIISCNRKNVPNELAHTNTNILEEQTMKRQNPNQNIWNGWKSQASKTLRLLDLLELEMCRVFACLEYSIYLVYLYYTQKCLAVDFRLRSSFVSTSSPYGTYRQTRRFIWVSIKRVCKYIIQTTHTKKRRKTYEEWTKWGWRLVAVMAAMAVALGWIRATWNCTIPSVSVFIA